MSQGRLLPPEERLERTLKMRVRGHQLLLLRWVRGENPGDPECALEYGARPASAQEIAMWDRLVILETISNVQETERQRLNDLIGDMTPAKRPGPTHGDAAEPRRG